VIGFFLLSAWHFGREDQHHKAKTSGTKHSPGLLRHVEAIAVGGLVIWVPALVRPSEMQSLLTLILPSSDGGEAGQIVRITQSLAWIFCPIACLMSLRQWLLQDRDWNAWVPLATAGIAAIAPILVSFTAYFCLWHSILGLTRLRSEEGLTFRQFIAATTPLSAMAVAGVVAISWMFRNSFGGATTDSVPASLQMLFIGLSAIAVPHLLLHEWAAVARGQTHRAEVPC
jgi:Brp/Blh family beta-carotene 15,15'-monooxygenase